MKIFKLFFRLSKKSLALVLFLLLIGGYIVASEIRHNENPSDKLMPTISQIWQGFKISLLEPDRRGEYAVNVDTNLWGLFGDIRIKTSFGGTLITDTIATGRRFFISIAILFCGLFMGLHMGLNRTVESVFYNFWTFFDKIPAIVLLPIIFIIFGLDEVSKIALVVIGVMPTIILDTYIRTKAVPAEEKVAGYTLGASSIEVAYRVVFPQIFPGALQTIKLNLKSMIILLLVGESLAASEGLGYRIFVLRRFIGMDQIIPYVIWISVILFLIDWSLTSGIQKKYPWLDRE